MMKKRAQAAMEFLMTYGWAILVVLLAIGALAYFGVLDPSRLLPESTTFPAPISNVDNALIDLTDDSIEVALINNKGVAISLDGNATVDVVSPTICNGPYSVTMKDNTGTLISVGDSIPQGTTFLLKIECTGTSASAVIGEKFKATVAFDYTNLQTGQTRSHIGSVQGRYE